MNISTQDTTRSEIARKIRALREARHWTQVDLSKRLGLSQGRFSEIERGQGSFTAEQFLEILKLFNVPVSHFVSEKHGSGSGLQNALARLGAGHLPARPDVLPSERLEEAGDVVRETLLGAESSLQIAALAPVLVRNISRINLNKLRARFLEAGLERRLAWLMENTLVALRHELSDRPPRTEADTYQRAEAILEAYLGNASFKRSESSSGEALDILDTRILHGKTLNEIEASMSTLSQRWGIATALQPIDFVTALKASHTADLGPPAKPGRPRAKVKTGKAPASHHRPSRAVAAEKPPAPSVGPRFSNPIEMDWD